MYSNNPFNYTNMPDNMMNAPSAFPQGTTMGMPQGPSPSPAMPQMMMPQPFPAMPQGMMPQGVTMGPGVGQMPMQGTQMPTQPVAAPVFFDQLPQTPVMSIDYTQGFLKTQIGKRVKVEFLIGTNTYQDRDGVLVFVGISYILLREAETQDLIMCDMYSIKFVRIYD